MNTLIVNATIATLDPARSDYGLIQQGAICLKNGQIDWVGPAKAIPQGFKAEEEHDLEGRLVTPGLIDCHTHLVYGGNRAEEFELLLKGRSYQELSEQGYGIASTVRATREALPDLLLTKAFERAALLGNNGVTTLEIKSGYGLSLEHERRCLQLARKVGQLSGLGVRVTCLAAHAVPKDFQGSADDYVAQVCDWLPHFKQEGLVDAVDAFIEKIAFSVAQIEKLFQVARSLGLPVKVHAEQLSNLGGTEMACRYAALSCDHLEYLDQQGVAAMAQSGSVAVMLPSAFYFIRETKVPPISLLREAGVPLALASDHNPGTSPILSPPMVMNMACTLYRMTPEESLKGYTCNAARALDLHDRGSIIPGYRGDLAVWNVSHPNEISYWMGKSICEGTFIGGKKWKMEPVKTY